MGLKNLFQGTPGLIVAVGAACLLFVGGCAVCGGGLLFPYVMRSRQAAAQRAQVEENLRQVGEAMHQKSIHDSAGRQAAESDAGDAQAADDHE
jgi:hypothetical protein